ncbi:hypothetical protein AAMO2058_001135900 [Amorphochlora amoebiformis]
MATPLSVSVCFLIQDYLNKRFESEETREWDEYCYKLALYLIDQMNDDSSIHEKTLAQLQKDLESKGIPEASSYLNDRLVGISSPDALFDTFLEFEDLLWRDETADLRRVDPISFFGLYLRKVIIANKTTLFDGHSRLYEQITNYRDDYKASYPVSTDKMEQYTHRRALDLEKRIKAIGSCEEVEKEISSLLTLNPGLHQAQFLRYVNYMQHKEYAKALDSLHRYFDYHGSHIINSNPTEQSNNPLQYAVLNLALLQYEFHHYSHAAQALLEAIRMAQLDNDHVCLVHALVLYADICHHTGETQYAMQLVKQCVEAQEAAALRADEVRKEIKHRGGEEIKESEQEILHKAQKVPVIESQAHLKLATYTMQQSSSNLNPISWPYKLGSVRALASEVESEGEVDKYAASVRALKYIAKSLSISTSNDEKHQISLAWLTRSKIWDLVGHKPLARLYSQIYLKFEDAEGSGSEESALAHTNLMSLGVPGKENSSYADRFPAFGYSKYTERSLVLSVQNCLKRADWDEASEKVRSLKCYTPDLEEDSTLHVQSRILIALLKKGRGHLEEARKDLKHLLKTLESRFDLVLKAEVLMVLVELHLEEGDLTSGFPYMLSLLSASQSLKLGEISNRTTLLVAKFMLALGQIEAARRTLLSLMPQALAHGSKGLKCDLLVTISECDTIGYSGKPNSTPDIQRLKLTLKRLRQAEAECRDESDLSNLRRVFYICARVCHLLGDIGGRNAYANRFSKVSKLVEQ